MGALLERCALDSTVLAARQNVITTYTGLALTMDGTSLEDMGGCLLCQGPFDLSFCNFAIGFDLSSDEDEAAETINSLGLAADDNPGINLFHITGDQPDSLKGLLTDGGFEKRHELASLAWSGSDETPTAIRQAMTLADRAAVGTFMTNMFFGRGSRMMREKIAFATSAAPHQLWHLGPVSDPIGAVMLVWLKDSLGIYNLCVSEKHRHKGIGREIVDQCKAIAASRGLIAVLQCELGLAHWYETAGFERIGSVESWRLSPGDFMI